MLLNTFASLSINPTVSNNMKTYAQLSTCFEDTLLTQHTLQLYFLYCIQYNLVLDTVSQVNMISPYMNLLRLS